MAADVFGIVGTKQAGVFRVERVVAEGGFAVVYQAMHEGFRSPVALKCLKVPEQMTEEERAQFLEKFREEGELLFRLSALVPAVVRPLHIDVLELSGGRVVPFLALEWLEGEGLDRIIEKRHRRREPPLDIHALAALFRPVAHALAEAHRLTGPGGTVAVIHRDLKPENLFVVHGPKGAAVKILDFGIARTKSAATLHAGRTTQGGALDAFTPGYAAPEQWLPKRYGQVGPWTDVFGLALTMVEALTGKPAIEGDIGAMMGTATDPGRRPTPRTEGAPVSDALEAAFLRALAVDPRQRTQTIDAFWAEIEAALGAAPSSPSASSRVIEPPRSDRSQPESLPPSPMASTQLAPPSSPGREDASASSPKPAPTNARPSPPRPPRPPRPSPPQPPPAAVAPKPAPVAPKPVSFELAAPVRVRSQMRAAATADVRDHGARFTSLGARLRMPIQLVVVAVVLSAADWGYAQKTGELLSVSGVRPLWIAAPLALIGVGLAVWRLVTAIE